MAHLLDCALSVHIRHCWIKERFVAVDPPSEPARAHEDDREPRDQLLVCDARRHAFAAGLGNRKVRGDVEERGTNH